MYKSLAITTTLFAASSTSASVIEFTDKSEWESTVGAYTTIDFVLPPSGTPITDQYADKGIQFSGLTFSHHADSLLYHDEWGLRGVGGAWAHFDTPQHWIAVDYPGAIRFELFYQDQSVYLSTLFLPTGAGNFAGLLSEVQFDRVYLHRWSGENIFIDDLHFGTFIPAPAGAALGLLGLAALLPRRRRRKSLPGAITHRPC